VSTVEQDAAVEGAVHSWDVSTGVDGPGAPTPTAAETASARGHFAAAGLVPV
jgi:hypothetical protein